MNKALLVLLVAIAGCGVEPVDHTETAAALTPTGDTVSALEVLNQLEAGQCGQPTTEAFEADKATEIAFGSLKDLDGLWALHGCSADPDRPSCASIASSQQTWSRRQRDDGCERSAYISSGNVLVGLTIRECFTCCDVRDNGTRCKTSCTREFTITW